MVFVVLLLCCWCKQQVKMEEVQGEVAGFLPGLLAWVGDIHLI